MPNSFTNSSHRSTPVPTNGPVFDPFVVGEDHKSHYTSTNIIKLEDSGKVFCPLCLEKTYAEGIGKIDDQTYHSYVGHLFEALDQHGERLQLRRILIPILEIILTKRSFLVKRDDDFHDLLRVIYKIMKSDKFNLEEFSSLTRILSGLSIRSVQPIPLKSAWKAWESVLNYGEKELANFSIDQRDEVPEEITKFYSGLAIIVKTYLSLVNRCTVDQCSDIVFPLYINDTPETLSRKYYIDSQKRCLQFISNKLTPSCSYHLSTLNKLTGKELSMVSDVYGAIHECFTTAIRINDKDFLQWLIKMDLITRIHSLFYRNPEMGYRYNINNYLKCFVLYHIEQEYGFDPIIRELNALEGITQTFARLAALAGADEQKHNEAIFYILVNCIAAKHRATYFVASRVRTVISQENEAMTKLRSKISQSRVIMRAYAYLLATVFNRPTGSNITKKFIRQIWRGMRNNSDSLSFREIFCFEGRVFNWAHDHPDFIEMVDLDTIDYLVKKSCEKNELDQCLRNLLKGPFKNLVCSYIKNECGIMFQKFIQMNNNETNRDLIEEFSGLLPALLQDAFLSFFNLEDQGKQKYAEITNLISTINIMLRNCGLFNPSFDEQFIADLSRLMEDLYLIESPSEIEKLTLVATHEFILCIIITNNPCLMLLLQCLNFTLLGHMYTKLEQLNANDPVVESIANVLIAYDNLDYPLEHQIEKSLYLVNKTLDWMTSNNESLNILSFKLIERVFMPQGVVCPEEEISQKMKDCLTTSLLNLLIVNPHIVQRHTKFLRDMFNYGELKYHPFWEPLMDKVPSLRICLELHSSQAEQAPQSPDLSFESTDTGIFEEEQICVSRILDQLHEEDAFKADSSIHVPKCIYLSRAIETQQSSPCSTQDWERRAYEATQSSNSNTQTTS